jgi:hypothetical protein
VGNDADAWRGGKQDAVWACSVAWTVYTDCSMGIMWPRKKKVSSNKNGWLRPLTNERI